MSVIGVLVSTFQNQRICMQTMDMLTDTKKQCKQIEENTFTDSCTYLDNVVPALMSLGSDYAGWSTLSTRHFPQRKESEYLCKHCSVNIHVT